MVYGLSRRLLIIATSRHPCLVGLGSAIAFAAGAPIRIGAPLPLTGPLSPEGLKLQQGYELWKEIVNKNGGIAVGAEKRPIEILYYDYQSATPKAVQLAEKLATDDKVDFMFSPFRVRREQSRLDGVRALRHSDRCADRLVGGSVRPGLQESLRHIHGERHALGAARRHRQGESACCEDRRDPRAQRSLSVSARWRVRKVREETRAGTVAYFGKYAINTLDHASALTEIKAAKPDWIVATGYINDMILIRKQMADLGLGASVVTMINAPAYQEFVDATGPLAENVTSATWWHPAERYASKDVFGSSEKYTAMFQDKFKTVPDFTNATGSAAAVVLQMAIEKAGSTDRDKVRAALAAGGFETFFGPLSFNAAGQAISYVPPVFQIQRWQADRHLSGGDQRRRSETVGAITPRLPTRFLS